MKSENRPCNSAPASISYGHSQEPKKNDIPSEGDGCTPKTKKKCLDLQPVMPFSSGEGLPYAPIDWPCQGDNWRWRVGSRITKAGFYINRSLFPPAHLQKPGCPKQIFWGRMTLKKYIRTEFPGADVDAFLASFSWKVRANTSPGPSNISHRRREKDEDKEWEEEEDEDKEWEEEEEEETTPTCARKRTQKPAPVPSTYRRRTRQSYKEYFPSRNEHEVITIDLTGETETSNSLTKDLGSASYSENDQVCSNQNSVSSARCSIGTSLPHVNHKESFMDALQEPLVETNSEDPEYQMNSISQDPSSSVMKNEGVEAQMKLSSLLAMDLPLSNLQEDPHLSVVQLLKLQMIEGVPLIGKYFLEDKQDMEADECVADLETNIANLNKKSNQSKEKSSQLQAEIDSLISAKREMDDQIAQLQTQCADLAYDVGVKVEVKNDLLSTQRSMADSISSVMQKVELGKTKKQELELKKVDAAMRVAEILAKYAS